MICNFHGRCRPTFLWSAVDAKKKEKKKKVITLLWVTLYLYERLQVRDNQGPVTLILNNMNLLEVRHVVSTIK